MRPFHCFILVLLVLISPLAAWADSSSVSDLPRDGEDDQTDPLTVELLTMGPGEHPFFKFGHNAIRLRDARKGTDAVYNYGTFSFSSPTLLRDFFKGRLEYWLSRDSMTNTIEHYSDQDRSVMSQRLALSPEKKLELKRQLEQNARPEYRAYKYDYFFDNCSTRVRDAIDRATDGQLHEALNARATQSLRDHALRATADYFLEYLVLSIGLGPLVDRPADRWAEAYLPEMLAEGLRTTQIRVADGSQIALVQGEEMLLEHHDSRSAKPPRWAFRFFISGTVVAFCLVSLAHFAQSSRLAALGIGLIMTIGGLLVGLLGVGLLSLWTLTDHAVAYRNQNLLLLSPFALALIWYGIRTASSGAQAIRDTRTLGKLLTGSALLALGIKLLPVVWQDNGELIAFFLPCWAGLWAASVVAGRQLSLGQ